VDNKDTASADISGYDIELEDELINADLNYNNKLDDSLHKKHNESSEDQALSVRSENVKAPIKKVVSLASVRDREFSLKKNDISVLNKVTENLNS
jgi:hypothetical protein